MTMKKKVTRSKSRMKRMQSYHNWRPAQIRWSPIKKTWELRSDYYRREDKVEVTE